MSNRVIAGPARFREPRELLAVEEQRRK